MFLTLSYTGYRAYQVSVWISCGKRLKEGKACGSSVANG